MSNNGLETETSSSENINSLNSQSSLSYLKFGVLPTWVIAIFIIGYILHIATGLFVWIVASFILMTILEPVYVKLRRKGFSTQFSAFLLIMFSLLVCVMAFFLIAYFSREAFLEIQESKKIFINYYQSVMKAIKSYFDGFDPTSTPLQARDAVTGKPITKVEVVESSPFSGKFGATLLSNVSLVATFGTYFFLTPILAFFLMAEREAIGKIIQKAFKNPERSSQMWKKIVEVNQAFFLGNLVLIAVTFPIFTLIFYLFSVSSFVTQAGLASFFNIIPFLGAMLAGFFPSMTLLGQTENVVSSFWLFMICVVIHFIVANFVTPKILGSKVNLNATTSTIALVAWSLIWGPMGLLLAIPITSMIKIIFEHSNYPWLCWIAALMSEKVSPMIRNMIARKN